MISNLSVSYLKNDLSYTINVETENENLPYNLAELFTTIIKNSDANEEIVLELLNDEFEHKK